MLVDPRPVPYRPGLIAKAVRVGIIAALAWLVVIAIMISDDLCALQQSHEPLLFHLHAQPVDKSNVRCDPDPQEVIGMDGIVRRPFLDVTPIPILIEDIIQDDVIRRVDEYAGISASASS
jgi:hypothetical protein